MIKKNIKFLLNNVKEPNLGTFINYKQKTQRPVEELWAMVRKAPEKDIVDIYMHEG